MPAKHPEIICLGEPMAEFNQQPDGRYQYGHGGDISNCAVAAARQGAHVGIISALGEDNFGQSFLELWKKEGIDTAGVSINPAAPTGIYFVTHGPDGHEFTYRRKGSAASLMQPADLPQETIAAARILHVSGISQGISDNTAQTVSEAIDMARAHDTLVSYDTNLRLKLWPLDKARKVIHEAMARCDIALPGMEDASQLCGYDDPDAIADFYLDLGAKIVALTLGAEGALVATAEHRERIPSIEIEAIDATAAGDTFDGVFLAHYVNSHDPFQAARYAVAAAALATTRYGAAESIPQRQEVSAIVNS